MNSVGGNAAEIEVRALRAKDPLADPQMARDLAHRFLIWDTHVAGARRVELTPLVLSATLHAAAVRAATDIVREVGEATDRAHHDARERACYGFHGDVHGLARASYQAGDRASLMRVDLLLDADGTWKACEINADCPGGHNEALGLPRLAREAGFLDGDNPTVVVDALCARLAALAGETKTVALLYATAYAEDLQVCALVQRMLERRGVHGILAPPTAPRLEGGRLVINGSPVGAIYRYFPAEYMEGQRNLPDIARAIASGGVRTLSSFAHIYCQSKLGFARAYAHAGESASVTRRSAMPATFDIADVPRDALVGSRVEWVVKRALGRVGDEVFVGPLIDDENWARVVGEVLERRAFGESWIAQRFVNQRTIPTPWGPRFVTLGAYVLDGAFVGYFARVTPQSHVSHGAMCVPVFTESAAA